MSDAIFKNKKLNPEKLLRFGFSANNGAHTYTTDIADGQFQMSVTVSGDGTVGAKVIDSSLNEEYVLHRASETRGSFAGMIRTDYENVLREISEKCFEPDVFKSDYARKVIRYVLETYHDEPEFLWQRFPGNAIFRRKDTNKWYGALLVLSRKKLGFNSDEAIDILDLRANTKDIESVVDGKKYFPGYHMNKKHWYTICLDGSVPIDEIFQRIDASYKLSIK
ncbi:MAG: MmcQ/YjbR family DNA-binding protein [Leptospirales bacterium]|nr:MmcQ/YjbR family DNA-binding protein [Leptospirales bacterium]